MHAAKEMRRVDDRSRAALELELASIGEALRTRLRIAIARLHGLLVGHPDSGVERALRSSSEINALTVVAIHHSDERLYADFSLAMSIVHQAQLAAARRQAFGR